MKFKRVVSVLFAVLFLISICNLTVFAGTWYSNSRTSAQLGHTSFSKSWEDYGTLKVNGVYYDFTYGFSTFLVNEDYIEYVHAQSSTTQQFYGKIKNYSGETAVTNQKTGSQQTNSAQVTHTGNSLTVYVYSREV